MTLESDYNSFSAASFFFLFMSLDVGCYAAEKLSRNPEIFLNIKYASNESRK
jgi:hypothetical protein